MAFCKLLTVLVLIHNTGGLLGAETESSIIGGSDAPKGKWPWMVHLNITSDGKHRWRCGGTIVSDQWVLTAASCWDDRLQPSLHRSMAWIGSHQLQKGAERYLGITHVLKDPSYRALSTGFENNIALIRLKKKLSLASGEKVKLPKADADFDASSDCWITGWGNIGNNVPLQEPGTLQELKIPIVSNDDCRPVYPSLSSNELCAGSMAGGKDACTGDDGGPLVCKTASGFVQVGIMSFGNPKGCGRSPSVYTRVSKYLQFINDYIHNGEEASAEV